MRKNIGWYIVLFIFLTIIYLPIMYITKEAFGNGNVVSTVTGNETLKDAIKVSLVTSIVATIVGVVIATLASLGLTSLRKVQRDAIREVTKLPVTYPDVVTAIGLMALFLLIFGKGNFGYMTLILAHISFTTAYAFIAIYPKAKKIGKEYAEAASDLGATPLQTLFKVIIPNLKGAIIAGSAIAFAMSFDDYIISSLNGGPLENISKYVIKARRPGALKAVYALTTLMFLVVLIGLIIFIVIKITKFNKKEKKA